MAAARKAICRAVLYKWLQQGKLFAELYFTIACSKESYSQSCTLQMAAEGKAICRVVLYKWLQQRKRLAEFTDCTVNSESDLYSKAAAASKI